MTHHTDTERQAFEAVASDYGACPKAIERDAKGNYLLMHTATGWMWWQAARRAPVVPVPQVTPEMVAAAEDAYMPFGDMELAIQSALSAAPQPPEAAPVQMPEPVAFALEWTFNGEERGMRLYDDETHCRLDAESDGGVCHPLYTEQQVRDLLAAQAKQGEQP